jgi:hypothetical protein
MNEGILIQILELMEAFDQRLTILTERVDGYAGQPRAGTAIEPRYVSNVEKRAKSNKSENDDSGKNDNGNPRFQIQPRYKE